MTSYGGYGVSMTPQFSIFVAFLMERGCLFALPNIRGGSEFGPEWHNAAKRRNRQTAYDDFLCAAEWLIKSGRTHPKKLAIFGGSNSGLLVGSAMTQRPDLFRAVVCMVPMLDMLRYHLFDNAHLWKDEFGTADDPDDFVVLCQVLAISPGAEGCSLSRHNAGVRRCRPELQSAARAQDDSPLAGRKCIRPSNISRLQQVSWSLAGASAGRADRRANRSHGLSLRSTAAICVRESSLCAFSFCRLI